MEATMGLAAPPAVGAVERASDAAKTPAQLFRWSRYVHVGDGAETCEHATDGTCQDAGHYHAWCRLPNQFQHSDIRERALAAKARRIRILRDPASDAYEVLESDLDAVRSGDREALVDELANRDWWKDHLAAMRELEQEERFQHIPADRDRLEQLDAQDPMARDNDERDELLRTLGAFNEAVEKRRNELIAPRREVLLGLSTAELVDQLRDARVQMEATAAFMDTYSKWEWFACTLRPTDGRPGTRMYASIDELEVEDPDILVALRDTFGELEAAFQRGPTGN